MESKRKPIVVVAVLVVIFFGIRYAMQHGYIQAPGIMKAIVASRVTLPPQQDAKPEFADVKAIPYPSASPSGTCSNPITFDVWEWNAMFGFIYANGGPVTTKGSLMEKYNVCVTLHREDSNDQMKSDLIKCAEQLHGGATSCSLGAAAIVVMGDGAGQWLADLDPELKKYGEQAIVIGAVGRSNGEDALLGPMEWKTNPRSMVGKTIVGVIPDGDWNIAQNYLGANGIKNNPDLHTYDPDAVNWIDAPEKDYIKAVTEVFVPNRCEDRKVVKDGRLTGEMKNVCPDGVVTWYPGDELAIHGRPGTVKVISSHEYASQMPAVIITLKRFANANRDEFNGLLTASFQAADQVKTFDVVQRKAGEMSAKVYKDTNADWYKAFNSYTDPSTRQMIGGSAVFNLEDDLNYFGLTPGHNNNMRATYETFSKIAAVNYPSLFSKDHTIPPYSQAVDPTFISGAQALLSSGGSGTGAAAEQANYSEQGASGEVRGKKPVYISFATGSNQILPQSIPQLNELKDQLAINSNLAIQLDGYTDNTGSDSVNIPLSKSRAQAVKAYLQHAAPDNFPDSRFVSVSGHGSADPIASNDTTNGKALNRRVEVSQIGR